MQLLWPFLDLYLFGLVVHYSQSSPLLPPVSLGDGILFGKHLVEQVTPLLRYHTRIVHSTREKEGALAIDDEASVVVGHVVSTACLHILVVR